jgi:hypothetical protein
VGGFLQPPGGGSAPTTALVVATDTTQTAILGSTSGQTFGNLVLPALPATQRFRLTALFQLFGNTGSSYEAGFQITDHTSAFASVSVTIGTAKLGSPVFGSNWVETLVQNLGVTNSQYMVTHGQQTFPGNNAGLATAAAQLTNASGEGLDLSQPSTYAFLIDTTNSVQGGMYFASFVELL